MKFEVESAANFLSNLLKLHSNVLSGDQLERFKEAIESHLMDHYNNHWFPDRPTKGSGYRCIRINHKMDPILSRAGKTCGLDNHKLRTIFPNELTLWIDPSEVSYRIGENGSICVLFDGSASKTQTTTSNSNSNNSTNDDNSSNSSSGSSSSSSSTSHNSGNNSDSNSGLMSHHSRHQHQNPSSSHMSNNHMNHGNSGYSNGGHHHQGSHNQQKHQQMHHGTSNSHHVVMNGLQHNGHHPHSVNGYNNHHQQQPHQHQHSASHHNRSGNRSPTDSNLSSSTSTMSSPSPSSSPDWCKSQLQYERRSSPDQWMQHHQQQQPSGHPQHHQQRMQQTHTPQGVSNGINGTNGDRHSSPVSVMSGVGMGQHQQQSSSYGLDPLGIFGYHGAPHPHQTPSGGYAFNSGVMNQRQAAQQRPPPHFAGYATNGWNTGSPY